MKPGTPITTTAGTLSNMNTLQLDALQANFLREGRWETASRLTVLGSDPVTVVPYDENDKPIMVIGIEPDGYTHS
jgi:hypothetical protein